MANPKVLRITPDLPEDAAPRILQAERAPSQTRTLPSASLRLSVIVPARNEEANLEDCLNSLLLQSEEGFALGVEWELIVIDDGSTDRTRAIAEQAAAKQPGVMVMEAPALARRDPGFTGKTNAVWAGAEAARGAVLLFTDADTIHQPGDLSRALHERARYEAGMLSYSPRQIVQGFWQRALMPLVFSELATVYSPSKVSDPDNRLAAANGQFILVEREAYFAVGGHRAVGTSVLEDVELANRVKRAGFGLRFRYAPDALATRMYRSFGQMVEGWTKNFAVLFPSPVALAFWRLLDLLLFIGLPAAAFGYPGLEYWKRDVILLLWVRTCWRFYSRVWRSKFPAADCLLAVFGLPLFAGLLLRSAARYRINKSVTWKGREIAVKR